MRRSRPIPWIAYAPALCAAVFALAGCSADAAAPTLEVGTVHQAIYAGEADTDEGVSAGVVSLKIGSGGSFELCTGSLVAPNVVLTARHCVSKPITKSVTCDENGVSGNGDHVGADEAFSDLHVYTGVRPSYAGPADAGIRAIVHPSGGVLCNADIALLVLDRPLTGTPVLPVRLTSAPRVGETVKAVGYGQNDDSLPVGTRLRKDAVTVRDVGRGVSASRTPLASHEFELGLSICRGDSGGPAISEQTGAVIGVVSRGGDCTDDFGHIYTTTEGFSNLFARAFELAGGAPELEPGDGTSPTASGTVATASTSPSSQGCSMTGGPQEADMAAWLAALLGAGSLLRRRRARS